MQPFGVQFNNTITTKSQLCFNFDYQRRQISFVGLSPAAVEANNHANVPIEDDDDDALEENEEEEDEDEEELVIASPFAKPELLTCISEENLFENNLDIMTMAAEDRGESMFTLICKRSQSIAFESRKSPSVNITFADV